MDEGFLARLLLSFLIGGLWVTLTTVIAERLGTKPGGVISGIPSTIMVALLFIGIAQGPGQAAAATTVIPAAFAVSCVFVLTYAVSAPRGLAPALTRALAVWFVLQGLLAMSGLDHYGLALLIGAVALALSGYAFERILRIRSHERVTLRLSIGQLGLRALFAGAVIAFAVLMSKVGGPAWGGIFASFPAVFTATFIITYRSAGAEFSRSMSKTHLISGVVNCVVYATAVRYTYPAIGLLAGTAVAYGASILSSLATYLFIDRKVT